MKIDELVELLQQTARISGNIEVRASAIITDNLSRVEVLTINTKDAAVIAGPSPSVKEPVAVIS